MKFFISRTSDSDKEPCPGACRVDLPVKKWWAMGVHPIGSKAINRKTIRQDGHLQLWAIDVDLLDDLFSIMAQNSKRDNEIIVGRASIDGTAHHYIEIYDDYRE